MRNRQLSAPARAVENAAEQSARTPLWLYVLAVPALASIFAIAAIWAFGIQVGSYTAMSMLDNAGLVFAFTAALWARNRTVGDTRKFWSLFAAGLFAWIIGEAILDVRTQLLGYGEGESIADIFYLLFYPFALGGLWVLDRATHPSGFDPRMLDALIFASVVVIATVQLVFVPYFELPGSTSANLVRLSYPALDAMLIWVVAYQAYNPRVVWDAGRWFILFGICFVLAADIGWTNLSGELYSILVAIAMMCFGSAALVSPSEYKLHTHVSKRRSELVPEILLVGCFTVLAALVIDRFGSIDARLIWGSTFVVAIAVTRMLLSFRLINRLLLRSERRALSDPLTGLRNHQYFEDRLSEEIERAQREDQPLALLMIDIDNFKTINDLAGHRGGDRILKQIASAMRDSSRSTDVACRIGGDEFAMLAPDTEAEAALDVARRLGGLVRKIEVPDLPGSANPTVSIGCSVYPRPAATGSELIENADAALYLAKQQGRDRVVMYLPDAPEPSEEAWQLHRAKTQLAARNADFRAVFAHARAAMVISDEAGVILMANDTAVRMFGETRELMIGRNVFEFVKPEETTELERIVEEAITSGASNGMLHLHLPGGGRPLVEYSTARFMPKRYLTIAYDVTERERAAKSVAEKEALFRGVFENANDAMLITDDLGVIRDANRAAAALTNRSLPELIGMSVEQLVDPEQAAQVTNRHEELLVNQTHLGTMAMRDADGNRREVEYSAVADFVPGLHLAIVREITGRTAATEEPAKR